MAGKPKEPWTLAELQSLHKMCEESEKSLREVLEGMKRERIQRIFIGARKRKKAMSDFAHWAKWKVREAFDSQLMAHRQGEADDKKERRAKG